MWVRLYNQATEAATEEKELSYFMWWLIVNHWLTNKNQANQ